MDEVDRAQQYQAMEIENALAARRKFAGTSAMFCTDCGAEIPEPRRKAVPGCVLCRDCQAEMERWP